MSPGETLRQLRALSHLTQNELAEKLFVTRQAVSRWETDETLPNAETLKQLSQLFDVSINTLLGSPRTIVCQCCGMPLTEDSAISREVDGSFNEDYCTWCYHDGSFVYPTLDSLVDYLVSHFPIVSREDCVERLRLLNHWK